MWRGVETQQAEREGGKTLRSQQTLLWLVNLQTMFSCKTHEFQTMQKEHTPTPRVRKARTLYLIWRR